MRDSCCDQYTIKIVLTLILVFLLHYVCKKVWGRKDIFLEDVFSVVVNVMIGLWYFIQASKIIWIHTRVGSRTAATSKIACLPLITECFILDIAAVLDRPLRQRNCNI